MEILPALLTLFIVVASAALGGLMVHLRQKRRTRDGAAAEAATGAQLEALATKLITAVNETFRDTSRHLREQSETDLGQRQKAIEGLVEPLKETLDKTERQIREIEKERKQDQGSLKEQIKQVSHGQRLLQSETARLVQALKKPQVRGRWGELTLRRTVELAGMVEHCDFEEQAQTDSEDGRLRPDMTVHLPNDRRVIVDAKTSLDAYLASLEAGDEEERNELLQRHSRQVAAHVRELASKAYWRQFDDTLDFVVMFVPGEQFLSAALEHDPALQENALHDRVLLATPTTLVALLRVIAYGWRQKSLEENAQEIRRLGEELHTRVATFTGHLARLRNSLKNSVGAYNDAVGSLERNVLPGARRFTELGIQSKKEIPETRPVEAVAREVTTGTTREKEEA